ncbi:unnamed protein product [Acanthoscelides obtectus]|uniref:Histone-lysine N-methyltransferase SETMAR n=1 Tax=Acanthoscelides obtectus TaxID=200917 RepID=A0A9P0QF00_ACAOB|nr:unnamed protein product [Acanthoscelides obtectus]CAK1688837.1 hypothetical protein AOBTE_LOCUS36915 [Acanthoscelides obtectus]
MLTKGVAFSPWQCPTAHRNRTRVLIERFGWKMVSHPPYSPDLAPSDFHLFPELKKTLAEPNARQMRGANAVVSFLHGTGGRVL